MNGYQFLSSLALGFTAIVIGWIYAPDRPPSLADDLVACGDLPAISYVQTPRFEPTREFTAVPSEYKIQVDAISQCRDRVIEYHNGVKDVRDLPA